MPNNTLEKWEECKICDCCEVYQPQTISTKEMIIDGKYPVFGANGQIGWYNKYNHEASEVLLTCRGATCGNINKSVPYSWINGNAMVISPKNTEIDKNYLYYFLNSIDFSRYITGAAQPQITRIGLSPLVIKYPNIDKQQRIVGILDEAFENIEKAKQNTLQNLNNAKELFESNVEQIFHYDCENIVSTTFSQEFKIKSGDFLSAQNMNLNGGYNVYGGNGINGKHDTYNYFGENIIIGRVGEKCGNIHYVNDDIWVTDNAFVLIDTEHSFDKRFLYYLLTKLNLRQYATKSTHPVISGKSLKDVVVSFPNNTEIQQKIVSQLDELQEQTKKLEQIYTQKLQDLDELKQSILQKAFNGEL